MRTTLTIDDDVLERARTMAGKNKQPFRYVVNEALRAGLDRLSEHIDEEHRYKTTPHKMGLRRGYNLDNIQELLAQVEGEDNR